MCARVSFAQNAPQKDCRETAGTQAEMNACEESRAQALDREMNQLYSQILERYKSDSQALARLKAAQRAWLQYRDAQLRTYVEGPMAGTVMPMCAKMQEQDLISERIQWLKRMLNQADGDVCTYPTPDD